MSLVLLLLLLIASSVSSHEIIITDQYQLEDFLCNSTNQLVEDTVVVLDTNITHFIRDVSFCVISTAYSLTITTNSSEKANVSCSNATIQLPTSGFAFTNVFKLTLHNLVFTYCGGYMRDFDAIKSINSTIYFTQHHSAVFVFLKINTLIIEEVRMVLYHGFAMVVVNPIQAAMNGMVLLKGEFNSDHLVSYGSGILMLFVDSSDVRRRYVSVNRSVFRLNIEYIDSNACLSDLQSVVQPFLVINSASFTILFTQKNFTANVDIANSKFYDNFGSFTAAVLILHYNSMTFSTVSIMHTTFVSNYNKKQCLGSDLSFVIKLDKTTNTCLYGHTGVHSLLSVLNSSFTNHVSGFQEKGKGGIIYMLLASYPMAGTIRITFKDVLFKDTYSSRLGSCMYVTRHFSVFDGKTISSKHVEVILESVTVMNNTQYFTFEPFSRNGLFMIRDIARLVLNGWSNFTGNVGSVFDIADTSIILAGTLNFEGNNGSTGTVFNVVGSGRFYLQSGLRAQFIRNNAIHSGGAIYAFDELFDNCMFILANYTSPNVSILFINNTARDCGKSVFSYKIYNCFSNGYYYNVSSARKLFQYISNGTLDGPGILSTLPLNICHCHSDICVKQDGAIAVYPGMALQLSLAAGDGFKSFIYTEVSVSIITLDKNNFSRPVVFWRVSNDKQVLRQGECTLINVTFFKNDESLNPTEAFLAVTASTITSHFKLSIYLRDCPVGFEFNPFTGKCNCSSVLYKVPNVLPKCMIFSKGLNITATIMYSSVGMPVAWIGMIILNGTYLFEMSSACFCCNYDRKYDTFIVNVTDNTVFIGESKDLHAIKSFCPRNRGGVMCSNCTPGYSVVFSSLDCIKCSNWWLLTIVAYGMAGPLLIYLIYALKLTLTTGLINGIIFYAQIVCISEQTKLGSSLHNLTFYYYTIAKGLISLLSFNINFNIPLCFYDGMTELWKSFLSFLFPVYLLAIVIGLIIISRYSVRLSNRIADSSVQVLVTVVHLSFTTLLTSTLDVFTPVYVYTNTSDVPLKVWQNDGTMEYGKGGHLILMIVTGVVVGPILITYLTVLLAGRPLMKINKVREYLRPIYEAIHAPYKHNKEFFSSITIILVIFLYLMNDTFVTKDPTKGLLLSVPFIMVYFILVVFYHPFKDVHLNILNAFLVSITSVVVSSVWYYFVSTITFAIIIASCDTVVIMTLVVIVLHNIPALRKLVKRVKLKVTSFLSSSPPTVEAEDDSVFYSSFFESCEEREPLLRINR